MSESTQRMNHLKNSAWLESESGEICPLCKDLRIGRSPSNDLVIAQEKVSRKHAQLYFHNDSWFLADLGSANGTYVNARKIYTPTELAPLDDIQIGEKNFRFRTAIDSSDQETPDAEDELGATLFSTRTVRCWLLVADIAGSTGLASSGDDQKIVSTIGGWFTESRKIIMAHGGVVNKFLGDGYFAYWPDKEEDGSGIARCLKALQGWDIHSSLCFRMALHFGEVVIGGMPTMGEESLGGSEVNFVFRMEKIGARLQVPLIASASVHEKLKNRLPIYPVGEHSVAGFSGVSRFYAADIENLNEDTKIEAEDKNT